MTTRQPTGSFAVHNTAWARFATCPVSSFLALTRTQRARHFHPIRPFRTRPCVNQLRNLITDVPGVLVGNAEDARLASGVTAIVFEEPAVGSIDVRGGGPGTRETALLDPGADGAGHRRHRARRAARPSASTPPRACRRGCASRAAALPCARRACRSCRAPSCSTCSTAATRTGAAIRPIASWATRPPPRAGADFELGSVGRGPRRHHGQPQGRPRLGIGRSATASRSARWRPSMRPAASWSATAPGSGRRRSSARASSAGAACRRRCPRARWTP